MTDEDKIYTGHHIEDKELIKNARKPEGELGHQILDRMNKSHELMVRWGVSYFKVVPENKILDIGCGGGRNLERFSKQISDEGKVVGIDYSEVSIEKSIKHNQKAIDEGKVEVIQGSVSEMPFEDESFDIATAFETIYFWPDFINDLKEVYRVLKKGGFIFICNEAIYEEGKMDKYDDLVELLDMKIYSEDVLKASLENAGFVEFKAHIQKDEGWICLTARKD